MLPRAAGRFFGAQSASDDDVDSSSDDEMRRLRAVLRTTTPAAAALPPTAPRNPRGYSTIFAAPPSSPVIVGSPSTARYGSVSDQGPEDGDTDERTNDAAASPSAEALNGSRSEDEVPDNAAARGGEEAVAGLTRRLRCLFTVVTWPIVPLGSLVTLTLLWMLYAAFWSDLGEPCSHSLHGYAVLSLILVSYLPNHSRVRSRLFNYQRERDGFQRPVAVRRFDQIFHTLALLYVYGGVTLVQTCRDDLEPAPPPAEGGSAAPHALSTCAATCPHLYRAVWVYVSVVELFTFSLILPLLFLPCIYLWFLRQATADADALAMLQERLQEEDFLFRNGGVTAEEVLAELEPVKLVRVVTEDDGNSSNSESVARLLVVPLNSRDLSQAKDSGETKSCCICMSDFDVQVVEATAEDLRTADVFIESFDEEAGGGANGNDVEAVVRTRNCGHLFHRHCIGSWVGGRWQGSESGGDEPPSPRRRARRTTCPLCRSDLRDAAT